MMRAHELAQAELALRDFEKKAEKNKDLMPIFRLAAAGLWAWRAHHAGRKMLGAEATPRMLMAAHFEAKDDDTPEKAAAAWGRGAMIWHKMHEAAYDAIEVFNP